MLGKSNILLEMSIKAQVKQILRFAWKPATHVRKTDSYVVFYSELGLSIYGSGLLGMVLILGFVT